MRFSPSLVLLCASIVSGQTYKLASKIPWSPKNATSVDQSAVFNGTYYLCDRTNNAVHVIDVATDKQTAAVGGFVGLKNTSGKADTEISGPAGLIVLPDRNELYVGDGDSSVKVISLSNNSIVANISTGGTKRADEFAYSPTSHIAVVTNPGEDIPYVSVISATSRTVLGKVMFTNNASGLEQPAWNSVNDKFYISVPSTNTNPGGEIDEIDVTTFSITKVYPLTDCIPAGIVFGPSQQLFVGCSQSQILDYNTAFSLVLDITTGKTIANISGLTGIDQVAYDPKAQYYYASAYQNLANGSKTGAPTPQLGIIDAKSNSLIQTITTDNVTAHSVAVDNATNQLFVPIAKQGILVYNLTASNSSGGSGGSGSGSSPSSSAKSSPSPTSSSSPLHTGAATRFALDPVVYTGAGLLAFCALL
jgi:hypothetical protein